MQAHSDNMFLLAISSSFRYTLRPAARRQMQRFMETMDAEGRRAEFVAWAMRALAIRQRATVTRIPPAEVRTVYEAAPVGLFRDAKRAYRPRFFIGSATH